MSRLPLVALFALLGCHAILPLGPPADRSGDGRGGPVVDGARPADGRPVDAARPMEATIPDDAGLIGDGPTKDGGPAPDGPTTPTRWATSYGGAGADAIEALVVDSLGNVYVAGWTTGADQDILVAKLSPAGTELWRKTLGGTGNDRGLGIALQGSNVYVTGAFEGTAKIGSNLLAADGATDLFLARLDAGTGNASWAGSWGSAGAEQGNGVTVDAQGNVYIVGDHDAPLDFGGNVKVNHSGLGDLFLVALQNGTTPIWAKGAGGNGVDHGYGVHANANSVWVVGQVWGGGQTLHDIYIASYTADAAGATVFETTAGDTDTDEGRAVAVDGSGNGYVTGKFSGTLTLGGKAVSTPLGQTDVFVARLDPSGSAQWLAASQQASKGGGRGIAHAAGTVAVTGVFAAPTNFGSTNVKPNGPLGDIFVATLDDVSGTFNKALGWGSPDVDEGHAIGMGGGAVYIAGVTRAGLTIGSTTLTFLGGFSDGFVARVLP